MTKTALYRHFATDGSLIYVGISANIEARTHRHIATSEWADKIGGIAVEWFDSKHEAAVAEWKAIMAERPMFNKRRQANEPRPPSPAVAQEAVDVSALPAPEQIEAWLAAEGRKKEWLAKQLGVHRTTLSQWLSGAYRPEEPRRLKMQELCGVAPDAWGRV